MNIKVSVILPNYNHEAFLKRRIDTILYQTFRDFELIILDDCSTDNSRDVIEVYRNHPKVSGIFCNTENSGSSFKQWNKGIGLAKGEWIWIAESDDWCENNFLEELIMGVEGNVNSVLAFAQSYCVDDSGNIKWKSGHTGTAYINGKHFFREKLVYGCTIFNASMAIFKKEFGLLVPQHFTTFKQCGDWYFWIHIVQCGDVFISNKLLNYYRNAEQSLTTKLYATGYNFIEELRMFGLLKNEQKQHTSFINSSVFNRYNSFKRRENKFSATEKSNVLNAFNDFFGGGVSFHFFLFIKRVQLLAKKMQLRLKVAAAPGDFKTGIT
ncbi:MAG: glycosyltransferase family 2 protein [Panacibacter sp.]